MPTQISLRIVQQVHQATIVLENLSFWATPNRDFQPFRHTFREIIKLLESLFLWEYQYVSLHLAHLFYFGSPNHQIHPQNYLSFQPCRLCLSQDFLEPQNSFVINFFVAILKALVPQLWLLLLLVSYLLACHHPEDTQRQESCH